jgi:hypothetical protein
MHFLPIFCCTPTIEKIKRTIFSQQVGETSYVFACLFIVSNELEILDECGFGRRGRGVQEHEFAFAGDNALDFLSAFLIADADSFLF